MTKIFGEKQQKIINKYLIPNKLSKKEKSDHCGHLEDLWKKISCLDTKNLFKIIIAC